MTTLSNEEYDERKLFLEDMRRLVKSEQEALFRILRKEKADFSENSNGIFFDISKLTKDTFSKLKDYMIFVKKNRSDLENREEQQKKAIEMLGDAANDD